MLLTKSDYFLPILMFDVSTNFKIFKKTLMTVLIQQAGALQGYRNYQQQCAYVYVWRTGELAPINSANFKIDKFL